MNCCFMILCVIVFFAGIGADGADSATPTSINKTIIITSILSPPFLMMKTTGGTNKLTGNDRYEGYIADLIERLAHTVGFKYEIRLVADGRYGSKAEDGTWNGMIGELTRKEADMAVAPLTVSAMRMRVVDFTTPFMTLGISIMIKKPERMTSWSLADLLFKPFSGTVWIGIMAAFVAFRLILFVVGRISPIERNRKENSGNNDSRESTQINRSVSRRVVLVTGWLVVFMFAVAYTANIVRLLTRLQHVELSPIESADDLARQKEIAYGTLREGSTKEFFRNSQVPVYERMWEYMAKSRDNFVMSTEEGVLRVRTGRGRYAFLAESPMIDYYNQRMPCDTMKIGGLLNTRNYAIAFPLGSDKRLMHPVDFAVGQLLESEFLQKLYKKWWYDKGECSASETYRATQLIDPSAVFYLLFVGLLVAVIMAVLEIVCLSCLQARRQKEPFSTAMKANLTKSVSSSKEENIPSNTTVAI